MPEFEPGPGIRLIEARSRLRRADLAVMYGETQTQVTESWAGSEKARAAYAELTDAARELVGAQEAFDAYCEARRVEKFGPRDTDVFPLDIALGDEGEPSWCVVTENGGRAEFESRGDAYRTVAGITGTGRRAAVYVRSASRYCFARYEVIGPQSEATTEEER